jgi:hypothetical protein
MNTENTRADLAALAAIIRGSLSAPRHAVQIRDVIETTIAQHASDRTKWHRVHAESAVRRKATPEPLDPLEPFGDGSGSTQDFAQWRRATPEPVRRAVISCLLAGWHDAEDGQSGVLLTRLFPGEGDLTAAVGDRVLRQRFHEQGSKLKQSQVAALIDQLGWDSNTLQQPQHGTDKMKSIPAVLTDDHESMLAVLGKAPMKCMTVISVASLGTIRNRETVGRLLRDLAKFGLVSLPYGKRKGYALTEMGRKWVAGVKPT